MAKVAENELRSAKPRLIVCVENGEDELTKYLSPYISNVDLGWDECLDEGFDPEGKTGLGPVRSRRRAVLSEHVHGNACARNEGLGPRRPRLLRSDHWHGDGTCRNEAGSRCGGYKGGHRD